MRLVWVGKSLWEVVVPLGDDGSTMCDEISASENEYHHAGTMIARLRVNTPRDGPNVRNINQCRPLWDGIYEFKVGPRLGKKLRVFWFYDCGEPTVRRRIVCSHWDFKRDEDPAANVKIASDFRTEYVAAKRNGTLDVREAGKL